MKMKMECCSGRCTLIFLFTLQLVTAVERQVFDFLGFQWAPILINFLQIVLVILGLFGTIQYRPRYVVLYLVWTLVWVAWNVLVSCLYLDLGGLSKEGDLLCLGLSSQRSWWKDHGPGCESRDPPSAVWQGQENPELVTVLSCWFQYQYIEVLHCVIQLVLSLLGFIYACYVVNNLTEEDAGFDFMGEIRHPSKSPDLFF